MYFIDTSEKNNNRFNNKSITGMETIFTHKYVLRNNNNLL